MLATKSKLLDKIESIPVKTATKVALAYSGGLDSSLCTALAFKKYGVKELIPVTVDVGQGEEEMQTALKKAQILGISPIVVDASKEFATQWLTKAIQANSSYEGYPVATSMTRQLIAAKVAQIALEHGCDAIMEGSSGKGNDQYRMHNVFKLFAPQLDILVPVRDLDLTRGEEEELSQELGIPITEVMQGGDDKTMWCRSLASGAIKLDQAIPENAWIWWKPLSQVKATPTTITVAFKQGVPVSLNGKPMTLPDLVAELNVVAGAHGIGKIDIFEDGIMGLKSRELYEAPAATVLLKLHHDLEQFTLTKEELQFKALVDQQWASQVYHGAWFSPLKSALDAFIASTQVHVTGTVTADLFKGTIDITSRTSDYALFFPEIRGLQSRSFNQQLSGPSAQIAGLPWEVLAKRTAKAQVSA
jgi:argininosuccinate synthase